MKIWNFEILKLWNFEIVKIVKCFLVFNCWKWGQFEIRNHNLLETWKLIRKLILGNLALMNGKIFNLIRLFIMGIKYYPKNQQKAIKNQETIENRMSETLFNWMWINEQWKRQETLRIMLIIAQTTITSRASNGIDPLKKTISCRKSGKPRKNRCVELVAVFWQFVW